MMNEGVMNSRPTKFLEKFGVISETQFGFQARKSTQDALLHLKDEVLTNVENKTYTLGLFVH